MKKLLLIPALMLFAFGLTAQTSSLGICTPVINAPQTVNYQDSATYSFAVKNYGPNVFNGDIHIYTGIWDTSMTYVTVIRIDTTSLVNIQNLNMGDSIWVTDEEHYVPQNFRIGTSVVVIWPVSPNALTLDSASYTVTVQSGVKVIEVTSEGELTIFPNPVKDKVIIGGNNNSVEQVRIMTASGRVISMHSSTGIIDVSHLSPGAYFAEVVMTNGARKVYRIVKQAD